MKKVSLISLLTFLVMVMAAFYLPVASLADDATSDNTTTDNETGTVTPVIEEPEPTLISEPEPVPADNITLYTEFPTLEVVATGSFQFNVTMNYKGQIERVFDLKTSAPAGWDVYIQPQYEAGKRISSITIDSSYSGMTKSITAMVSTPVYPPPDPGEYKILLQAVSGNVSGSVELIAKITAKYSLQSVPLHELYNTSALSGKDNIYSIQVTNLGSAQIDNITFDSTHPEGWEIKFAPEKLELLKTSDPKVIDVNIKPPPKTVAGDYMITLRVSGKQASADKMDIRVTVKTPTIWGWVGVIIIIVVVAGLFVIFIRFGRR
jgi:uncharacterized membrane protein